MSRIEAFEKSGQFVKAETLRRIGAARKKVMADGTSIASAIIDKVRADMSEILGGNELSTAIFYIEKSAEAPLQSLQSALASSIQEVLNKIHGV